MIDTYEKIPLEVQLKLQRIKNAITKIADTVKTNTLTDKQIEGYLDKVRELKKQYRILRGEYDVLYFAYEYFSEGLNPDNDNNLIPSNYSIEVAPPFHQELCGLLDSLVDKPTQRIGWSVPRGHGKSAYLSNVFPVHQVVYKKRNYIIIISETQSMSEKFVEWVGDQLKFNKKLIADFGEILSTKRGGNEVDTQEAFVTLTGIRVQSSSLGRQLRGARHGAYRPDLIILDDLESSKNTNTKELRDKNLHWFNSVIMPIGDPTKTAFIYMGTLVHGNGLLPSVLKRSDFRGKIYSAIVSQPNRADLWQNLEEMLSDVTNPDREYEAEQFYYANKDIMDQGVKTLWEDRFTYLDLVKIKVNVGSKAFSSEYLNKPSDDESSIFKSDYFQYYDDKDLYYNDGRPMNLEIYGFWDIAIGKNNRSDYNAIITIGRDRRTGVMYVLDAWLNKVPMHEAKKVVLEKIRKYKHKAFGIEVVQAQYDAFRQVREELMTLGHYSTKLIPINPKGRKEDRIEQLEPLVESGYIRFKRSQRLLLEQLEGFGSADYDDGPDALASVVDIAAKQKRRTFHTKPTGY